ncbi:MAG: tRNA (adenosine(37)-N6)-threonylcarbamoyltransferase complex dimerization subunit type 1 TsaB [candidate division NC10 bacterium]|nr:tRNA (adenosine(37)-N6)-threonylcarbamoyltransferase complex dimerization subunit type 1 TsaB [candidate division NC10 bacterium]
MRDTGLISEYTLNIEATHSERLLPSIHRLLSDAGLKIGDPDGIAVALGPGSFTGLRIGLSTAKGLALASGKPVVGVPTLEAMAWNLPFCPYWICPILDARKKEVYCAIYRFHQDKLETIMGARSLSPQALLSLIREPTVFLGDGLVPYGCLLKEGLGDNALFAPLSKQGPSAANVAELGLWKLGRGEVVDPASLVPIYIRPSEAELKLGLRDKGG